MEIMYKKINKYLQGRPVWLSDLVLQTAKLMASKKAADRLELNAVNESRELQGNLLPTIVSGRPKAFNYGDDLMVRGSELLKYPQLYSHMGPVNTKDSNILPDLYYKIGSKGSFDPTHFTAFNNTDTYTPMPEYYLLLAIDLAIKANENYGLLILSNKLGSILPKHEVVYQEPLTALGTVPAADDAFAKYSIYPTDLGADNLRSIYTTTGALARAVAGNHPAGAAVFASTMGADAYDRIKNPKGWQDYAIGGAEGVLTGLSLLAPLTKAYLGIRSAISPKYALSRAIDTAPLDVDMLNSYRLNLPLLHYLFSDWQTFNGAHPFEYQVGHIHDVDLSDIGILLARLGYFNNPKPGNFMFDAKLPSGKSTKINKVETQPSNYPVLVSANPELPLGYWGKRGSRNAPERVIASGNTGEVESSNTAKVVGYVGQDGKVHVVSSYPNSTYATKSFPILFNDLNSKNPSYNIAGKINEARQYWDTHAIVDEATPARDPFKRGTKKSYIPFKFSTNLIPSSKTNTLSIWQSGKLLTIDYIMSPTHKERLMNLLKLTELLADNLILLELKNLNNVELVNLGLYKIGRQFGHTIGYSVEGESGSDMFPKILDKSDWLPNLWSELKYRNFIDSYVLHALTYDKAKRGITLVGIAEGDKPVRVNAGFEEGTHATTRGGIDPVLSPIILHDTKLASSLLGLNPGMLDPMEARTVGIELDRAWDALKDNLPGYYNRLSPSALRRLFFYDILRASDDAGKRFYLNVPKEWRQRFDPEVNYILNKGANGLDPDEAFYNFWENFVYNDLTPNNLYNIT